MIGEGRVMNSRLLQQLVRFVNPPEADNDAIMEFVVYASERIRGLKECPAQAAKKIFSSGEISARHARSCPHFNIPAQRLS
jgi:hypothetical protein